jgi:hypothetical protein
MDFEIRHLPELLQGNRADRRILDYKCKHIIAAHLLNSAATIMMFTSAAQKSKPRIQKTSLPEEGLSHQV